MRRASAWRRLTILRDGRVLCERCLASRCTKTARGGLALPTLRDGDDAHTCWRRGLGGVGLLAIGSSSGGDEAGVDGFEGDVGGVGGGVVGGDCCLEEVGVVALGMGGFVVGAS